MADVTEDQVVIETTEADINTEAQKNLWTFSITEQQAQEMKPKEVLHFLEAVLLAREKQIIKQFGEQRPMVFYCWFDEQAVQLRFSLVSAFHNRLPFGSQVNVVGDLASIVERFLASSYHSGIPTEEFIEDLGAQTSVNQNGVSVWAKQIPIPRYELDLYAGNEQGEGI